MSNYTYSERADATLEAIAQNLWSNMRDQLPGINETAFLRVLRTHLEAMKPWLLDVFQAVRDTP